MSGEICTVNHTVFFDVSDVSDIYSLCSSSIADEEQVINGHKLKIDSGGNHQKVVGKMDPNNVNVVAQGPQTVSVTSSGTDLSQDVVFDPNPYCPDKPCPPGQSGSEGKGHH